MNSSVIIKLPNQKFQDHIRFREDTLQHLLLMKKSLDDQPQNQSSAQQTQTRNFQNNFLVFLQTEYLCHHSFYLNLVKSIPF